MRDPQGSLRFEDACVVRRLHAPLPDSAFLHSALARRWVDEGRLVPFSFDDPLTIRSPRLPFVTQPTEWCDAQLHAAAEFTLALQSEAVAAGFDLKDASAWNVIFDGCKPVFCDLLSMVPLTHRKWWAAGQFARHFILPLLLSRRRGLRAADAFKVWRDGVPPPVARRLLGPMRYFTRYWPLMADGQATAVSQAPSGNDDAKAVARFREGLQASLAWMLAGVRQPLHAAPASAWDAYVDRRDHYNAASLQAKRDFVSGALAFAAPTWVADLGCNTGEFSRLAQTHGARVVALDADHESVQRLFRSSVGATPLYPVVASLDDLSGGRGWLGREHPGLAERMAGHIDLVMMLALVHHLCVAAAVPLHAVAAMAASWTRQWLIVEWVGSADPQMQLLCAQRQRDPADFSVAAQRVAFLQAGFTVDRELRLDPADRVLALLRRSS